MIKRIDVATLPVTTGTLYPSPFDEPCRARQRTRLADAAGLTQYGVNLVRLKAGDEDGHHLQNRSSADVTFLEVGTRLPGDGAYYCDIDMMLPPSGKQYCHRDGRPYPKQERRGP